MCSILNTVASVRARSGIASSVWCARHAGLRGMNGSRLVRGWRASDARRQERKSGSYRARTLSWDSDILGASIAWSAPDARNVADKSVRLDGSRSREASGAPGVGCGGVGSGRCERVRDRGSAARRGADDGEWWYVRGVGVPGYGSNGAGGLVGVGGRELCVAGAFATERSSECTRGRRGLPDRFVADAGTGVVGSCAPDIASDIEVRVVVHLLSAG